MKTFIEDITSACASYYHIYFEVLTNYNNKQDGIKSTCLKMKHSLHNIYLLVKEEENGDNFEFHLYDGDSAIFVQKGNKKESGVWVLSSTICNKIIFILKTSY
jgi:hypothetical protein